MEDDLHMKKRLTAILVATTFLLPIVSVQADQVVAWPAVSVQAERQTDLGDISSSQVFVDDKGSTIEVDDIVVTPLCEKVSVAVRINNTTDLSIGSYIFHLEFDDSKLEVTSVRTGEEFNKFAIFDEVIYGGKHAIGSLSASSKIVNEAELVIVTFTILDNSESVIPIQITYIDIFYDEVIPHPDHINLDVSRMFDDVDMSLDLPVLLNDFHSETQSVQMPPIYQEWVMASIRPGPIVKHREVALFNNYYPDAIIRFTTDNTTPNSESQEYTKPISIDSDTVIRARLFIDGNAADVSIFQYYVQNIRLGHVARGRTITAQDATQALRIAMDVILPEDDELAAADLYGDGAITSSVATTLLRAAMYVQTICVIDFYESGVLNAGVNDTATFPMFVAHNRDGTFNITVNNLPTGVTAVSPITITNNTAKLELRGDNRTVPQTRDLVMNIGNIAESVYFTLNIE